MAKSYRPATSGTRVGWLAGLQVAAVLGLAVAPPASGRMLIVPLSGSATVALADGVRLVGRGPLPGTLLVDAERATLLPHLWRRDLLLLAAPAFGCGGAAA